MLTQPELPALLARLAAVLETTVQPDPAAPYARQQVKAAVFALRDLETRARLAPGLLQADVDDMRAVLAEYSSPRPGALMNASMNASMNAMADQDPAGLAVTHRGLQEALEQLEVELLAVLDANPDEARARAGVLALRATYRRALERERAARQ